MPKYYETEMYQPVKDMFESMGYKVNAEVKGCDVTACKENQIIIIELKTAFSLKLLYQCLERLKITDQVFLAVPRPVKSNTFEAASARKLVKQLGFGMIYVALDSSVKEASVLFWPMEQMTATRKNRRKKQAVINEITARKHETNIGGSHNTKLNTAYRERCVKIACIIEQRGCQSAKALVNDYGCEKDAYAIISKGPYGWFTKVGKGIYGLSPSGRAFLDGDEFRAQVYYYRTLYKVCKR